MVGGTVYPRPAFVIRIDVIVPAVETLTVAAAETEDIPANITDGEITYPDPAFVTVIIPTIPSPSVAVAVAPFPPPPINLTPGVTVYPYPAFVRTTLWTDCACGFVLSVQTTIPPIISATALAVPPPTEADDIPTVGVLIYPPPRFVTVINLIPPFTIEASAVAVTPTPTIVRVVKLPTATWSWFVASSPLILSSINPIPVSTSSSSYLKSSHLNS